MNILLQGNFGPIKRAWLQPSMKHSSSVVRALISVTVCTGFDLRRGKVRCPNTLPFMSLAGTVFQIPTLTGDPMCKDGHPCRLKNPTIGNLNGYYNVGSSCKRQHLSGFCFGYYPCISQILFIFCHSVALVYM